MDSFNFDDDISDNSDDLIDISIIKNNINLLDTYTIEHYPEPYYSIAHFLLSAISGASTLYITNLRVNKKNDYIKYFELYFKYCAGVKNDNYINEFAKSIKLDLTSDIDSNKFSIILNKLKEVSKDIMNDLIDTKHMSYQKYIIMTEKEFSIEALSKELTNDIIPFIKFSKIVHTYN